MFENRVLKKLIGAKRGEMAGDWRRLRNGKLHSLCSPANILRMTKSRRLRLTGHVARMVRRRMHRR
jgi:hypothetical protein